MSDPLSTAIARAAEIRAQITLLQIELKPLEKIIEQAGINGPHVPLEDAEREGKQTIIRTDSHVLRVRLESDNLVTGFEMGSDLEKSISALLTTKEFNDLFKPVKRYDRKESDGHKFRLKAKKAIVNQDTYLKLIRALRSLDKDGIPKSKTVVAWDTLETLTPAAQS
jgi:hypothetical protein